MREYALNSCRRTLPFAELKAWIKKNHTLTDQYESFDRFLEAGLRSMSQKPGNHFRSCHIAM